MDKKNWDQYFSQLGFSLIGGCQITQEKLRQLKIIKEKIEIPLAPSQLKMLKEELNKSKTKSIEVLTALFPIPSGDAGFPELNKELKPQKWKDINLYELTAPFARFNYYKLIVKKLKSAFIEIKGDHSNLTKKDIRIFCNSALPEKLFTILCGISTIGKNNLVRPKIGTSSVLIGGIIFPEGTLPSQIIHHTNLSTINLLKLTKPGSRCGSCTRCIEACPVKALSQEKIFNRPQCLQQLSSRIDPSQMQIPKEAISSKQALFYGCTQCQTACPHWKESPLAELNKQEAINKKIGMVSKTLTPTILANLPIEQAVKQLEEGIKKSALSPKWINRNALLRNLKMIAQSNQWRQDLTEIKNKKY